MTEGKRSWVVQLIQSSFVKQNYQYLPYAAGLLQAYAMRHASDLSRYVFLPILLERMSIADTLRQIQVADVYGYGPSYLVSAAVSTLALPFLWLARRERAGSDPIESHPAVSAPT